MNRPIVTLEEAQFMRQLAARPDVAQGPVPDVLLAHGFACLGYDPREEELKLGYPTRRGLDWLEDVLSGGRLGSALWLKWQWEQRARFAEARLGEVQDDGRGEDRRARG